MEQESFLVAVAKTAEVPAGRSLVVEVDGDQVAIFNVKGEYFAVRNRCPHAAGPLDQGFVEDGCVICPWHGWMFPLSAEGAPNDGVGRYRVVVEGENILIDPLEL